MESAELGTIYPRTTAVDHPEISVAELKKFIKDFQTASRKKDRTTLNKLLHDNFTLIDPEGKEVGKKELINAIVHPDSSFMRAFQRNARQSTFALAGNAVRQTADVKMTGKLKTRGTISGDYTNTATFVRGPRGWQMIGNSLHKKP